MLRLAIGFVATFYGRHFTYIILYAQVLRGRHTAFFSRLRREIEDLINKLRASRPRLREATSATQDALRRIGPLQEAYQRASASGGDEHEAAVLQMELDELQQDLLRMGHAGTSVIGALDPDRLGSLAREVYLGLAALADAATANGASRLGITFDIGERVISRVDAVLTPLLYRSRSCGGARRMSRGCSTIRALSDSRILPSSDLQLDWAQPRFPRRADRLRRRQRRVGCRAASLRCIGPLPYRWQQRALEAGDEARASMCGTRRSAYSPRAVRTTSFLGLGSGCRGHCGW